jgi:hypothetical protein
LSGPAIPPLEIDSTIRRLEEEHDLLRYEVDGWSAWTPLRFPIQWTFGYDLARHNRPWAKGERIAYALRDLRALTRASASPFLVKTFTSGLTEPENGGYRDVWFDPLVGALGTGFRVETINNRAFLPRRGRAAVPSNMTSTAIDLIAALLARARPPRGLATVASDLSAYLTEAFPGANVSRDWVASRIGLFAWQRRLYGQLLDRVTPKFVLAVDPCEHGLFAAARERGIPSFELQHGFIDPFHSAYSWTAYAERYASTLPLPDKLLLYGEHWRRQATRHGFWASRARVVGSPRMDMYRSRRRNRPEARQRLFLVTTQGIAGRELVRLFRDFLEHGPSDVQVIFKLHPAYDPDPAPFRDACAGQSRITVVAGSEDPSTFALLSSATWHATISSTCHYEALGLGIPTFILPFDSHEFVLPLAEAGHADVVSDGRTLAALVSSAPRQRVSPDVIDLYFKQGAVANICAEISRAGVVLPPQTMAMGSVA